MQIFALFSLKLQHKNYLIMKNLLLTLFLPLSLCAQVQVGGNIFPELSYERSGSCTAISADGQTVVAGGQPLVNPGVNSLRFPRARVYSLEGEDWVQKGQSLELTDISNIYYSLCKVALSSDGNIVALGNICTGINSNQGMVRVYEYNNGTWLQKGQDIVGEEKDYLAYEISLSADGNIMAIVAEGDSNYNFVGNYGNVTVYEFTESGWEQRGQKIMGYFTDTGSGFITTDMLQGTVSLSNDGNKMVIGCYSTSGNVKVFEYDGTTWQSLAELDIPGNEPYSYGWDVTISGDGNTVAASAISTDAAGSVKIYQQSDNGWIQKGQTVFGELNYDITGDFFGQSVSLSDDGTILAVGAPQTMVSQYMEGRARVFKFNNDQWVQLGNNMDGQQSVDYFGSDVSISGSGKYLAVGAPNAYNYPYAESGVVKVYDLTAAMQSDNFSGTGFSLYPNPAQNMVNISLNDGSLLTQANVYNALGQLLITGTNAAIDISGLSSGTYFIEAATTQGVTKKTFIKQ